MADTATNNSNNNNDVDTNERPVMNENGNESKSSSHHNNGSTMDSEEAAAEASARKWTPSNPTEQLRIVNSFERLHPKPFDSVEQALDIGYDSNTVTDEKLDDLLEEYGRNELPKAEVESYFALWLGSFKDIMMILLVIAMAILYVVGDRTYFCFWFWLGFGFVSFGFSSVTEHDIQRDSPFLSFSFLHC